TGRETRTFAYEPLQFPLRDSDNDFLPRLWATRRVGWLMEQIRTNGEQKELRDEIVDLGTRYGIVTPYTSYLAVEPNVTVNGEQPVTGANRGNTNFALDGRNANAAGASSADSAARMSKARPAASAPMKEAASARTGTVAVQQSKRDREQQEMVTLKDEDTSSAVRKVGGKTFYLREGVWTDAEFKADAGMRETALVFGSEEYFALLKSEPRLSQYFALGERVIVVLDGQVYRVNASK
ncbi:MAG: hypothetical protein JOZ52_09180, partial [Acidobacteria bacterium]|nr:hypothetical protein [Acidobacteriota bacterium]